MVQAVEALQSRKEGESGGVDQDVSDGLAENDADDERGEEDTQKDVGGEDVERPSSEDTSRAETATEQQEVTVFWELQKLNVEFLQEFVEFGTEYNTLFIKVRSPGFAVLRAAGGCFSVIPCVKLNASGSRCRGCAGRWRCRVCRDDGSAGSLFGVCARTNRRTCICSGCVFWVDGFCIV